MKLAILFAALLVTPSVAAARSPFDGIPGVKFEYYDVEGRTSAEIYASMRARAPRGGGGDGTLGLGRTAWQSNATWREFHQGGRCTVSDAQARLSIRVMLPRLVARDGLTREGLAFWRSSITGLEIHEAGHARIAWDHRDDFREAAQNGSCASVGRVAKAVQARIVAIQDAYDRDTRHGQTQMPPVKQ